MKQVPLRNTTVDIGRLIASFFVVCLHTYFPIPFLSPFVSDIAKVAVPFFYMVSGFYIYNSDNEILGQKLRKNILSLCFTILQAGLVYGILRFVKHFYFKIDISSQSLNLIPFLLYNDFNFTEHLWYLFAFLYVLFILYIFSKFKIVDFLVYILPILFIIHIVFTIWSRVLTIDGGKFWMEFNWLVIALPFVTLGMYCKKNLVLFTKLSLKYDLVFIPTLILFVFLEHYAFKSFLGVGPGVLSIIVLSFILFIYSINDFPLFNRKLKFYLANLGKLHSLNIYLYHVLIRELFSLNGLNTLFNNTFSIFVAALLLSTVINSLKLFKYKPKV